ncbi:MAG: hypothetical protein M3313_07955, partial [Actinomycetota bacterium]|nr:hypothetical protein [Actinomycetota bacterium]
MTLTQPSLTGLEGYTPSPAQQWCGTSMQMINWGGFEGHHKIGFADTATLLAGASGTGKSTLLDAYIALMMDSNTPFNGASNDNVSGRARNTEQRNVLSYVRGKIDTSREAGTGDLRDEVLRGRDTSAWSAVAMTWRNNTNEWFTALRVYYAPVSATSYSEVTAHLATIEKSFDLRSLEAFAADRFPHQRVKARFPGIEFHTSYETFAATLHTRLGIGAGGDGAKALKLLARIQGGRQVTTVDGLYKTMVLERPRTYAIADRAIAHFDDLQASYETMRNAEAQVKVLEDIPDLHQARVDAEANAALIDTLRIQSSDEDTPFALWYREVEAGLLGAEIDRNRAEHRDATEHAKEASSEVTATKAKIADIQEQQRDNGGAAVNAAERVLKQLQEQRMAVAEDRVRFNDRTHVLGRSISTEEDFDALRADSETFLATVTSTEQQLQKEADQVAYAGWPLRSCSEELERERNSLKGREGLVPQDLHGARLAVARALGVQPEELPFVAELIDMDPSFEAWREAAELALGGFAVTMLVDERRLGTVRREINSMHMGRRLRFEGVELNQRQDRKPDRDRLPARFITKDTPFTPWVMTRLMAKFDYTCVDAPADLDHTPFGLTITGQTRERRRGAHGGHGAVRVIGFSNEGRLEEIALKLETIEGQLVDLARQRKRVGAQQE